MFNVIEELQDAPRNYPWRVHYFANWPCELHFIIVPKDPLIYFELFISDGIVFYSALPDINANVRINGGIDLKC